MNILRKKREGVSLADDDSGASVWHPTGRAGRILRILMRAA
jgi:hypothetical protein